MRQFGEVIRLEGNKAQVKVVQHSACANCHQKCGLAHEMKDIFVEATNTIEAKPGDKVTLELHHSDVLYAAIIVYVVPLVFLFAGVALGGAYFTSELYALGLGLLGLVGSFVALKYGLEPRLKHGKRFHLAIVGYSDDLKCEERGMK